MKEVESVLALFQHVETFFAFLLFIVPGFISLRCYEMRRAGENRKVNEALVDVVIYSFITDVIWIPIFEGLAHISILTWRTIAYVVAAVLFVATAVFVGRIWYSLQTWLAKSGAIADPTPKPWDHFFDKIGRTEQIGIILTLPDGRKLGGRYAPGFASSYPADEQVHIGQTWRINQESGAFEEPVDGSLGFIVNMKDALTVEFFDWNEVERTNAKNKVQNEQARQSGVDHTPGDQHNNDSSALS